MPQAGVCSGISVLLTAHGDLHALVSNTGLISQVTFAVLATTCNYIFYLNICLVTRKGTVCPIPSSGSLQNYSSWSEWLSPTSYSTLLQHCKKQPQPEYIPFLAAGKGAV